MMEILFSYMKQRIIYVHISETTEYAPHVAVAVSDGGLNAVYMLISPNC